MTSRFQFDGAGASVMVVVTVMGAEVTIVLMKLEQCSFRKLSSPRAALPVTAARQASSRLMSGLATATPAIARAAADLKREGIFVELGVVLTSVVVN